MKRLLEVVLISIAAVLLQCWYIYRIRNGGAPYKIDISATGG
jgi:hypothetical protein